MCNYNLMLYPFILDIQCLDKVTINISSGCKRSSFCWILCDKDLDLCAFIVMTSDQNRHCLINHFHHTDKRRMCGPFLFVSVQGHFSAFHLRTGQTVHFFAKHDSILTSIQNSWTQFLLFSLGIRVSALHKLQWVFGLDVRAWAVWVSYRAHITKWLHVSRTGY